jgi:hypothetical protein
MKKNSLVFYLYLLLSDYLTEIQRLSKGFPSHLTPYRPLKSGVKPESSLWCDNKQTLGRLKVKSELFIATP